MSVTRRRLLAGTGAEGRGSPSQRRRAAVRRERRRRAVSRHDGYGPLVPDPRRACWTCRAASDTPSCPGRAGRCARGGRGAEPLRRHVRLSGRGRTWLVRNHENRPDAEHRVPPVDGVTYDPGGLGGCTALEVDRAGRVRTERVAIAGTAVNCVRRPNPMAHLADLRGDRGPGRYRELHQGPRVHLRGRPVPAGPDRPRAADRDGAVPARGDRRRPARRHRLRDRGRVREAVRAVLPLPAGEAARRVRQPAGKRAA